MRLLKVHRLLIASSIVMCLLYALRAALYASTTGHLETLMRIGLAILGAAMLGLYLYTIRTR